MLKTSIPLLVKLFIFAIMSSTAIAEPASSTGSPSGSGGQLTEQSDNTFEGSRYEPAGNGFVWNEIILEGNFGPDTTANSPGSGNKLVTASIRLNRKSELEGYKYQGEIYPYQPVEGTTWTWQTTGIDVSGDVYENGNKVASFEERVSFGSLGGSTRVGQIQASGDSFNKGDFEFRNIRVLPEESDSNNRQIQSHLDKL